MIDETPNPTLTSRQKAAATKRARSRAAILEAAAYLMVDVGWDIPLDQVSRRASVSNTTLFKVFPTKADLAMAVFTEAIVWPAYDAWCSSGRANTGDPFDEVELFLSDLKAQAWGRKNILRAALIYRYQYTPDEAQLAEAGMLYPAGTIGELIVTILDDAASGVFPALAAEIRRLSPEERSNAEIVNVQILGAYCTMFLDSIFVSETERWILRDRFLLQAIFQAMELVAESGSAE